MTFGLSPQVERRLAVRQAMVGALIGLALGMVFSVMKIAYDHVTSEESERRDLAQMLAVVRAPAAQASYHLNPQGGGRGRAWSPVLRRGARGHPAQRLW